MAWSAASVVEEQIARIREQVGDGRVICGLSGGVDSSVAALLTHRAVGDQLTCVFVDHGMMRKNEGNQVVAAFRDQFKVPLIAVDAEERFLDAPGRRHRSGDQAQDHRRGVHPRLRGGGRARSATRRYLVQGTLYSDVIESGGGTGAATIKSHHNVGGLPDDLEFELVEPLRALFKDEVRAGRRRARACPTGSSGASRSPAPASRSASSAARSPRSASRSCARRTRSSRTRSAPPASTASSGSPSACCPGELRSVGVQGDGRTYGYVVVIRAVTSDDAMTADWARLPYDLLERVASRMINEIAQVNRVTLDITSKPPGTIEWE